MVCAGLLWRTPEWFSDESIHASQGTIEECSDELKTLFLGRYVKFDRFTLNFVFVLFAEAKSMNDTDNLDARRREKKRKKILSVLEFLH